MAADTQQLPPVTVTGSSSGGSMSAGALMGAELGSAVVSGLFGRASAKSQMRFQEHMASTQYQRAAKDLEAAGLNRIIALGSPADSPGGAGYSMPKADFNAASAADVNRKNSVYQRELMEAQRNNTEQATNTGKAQESLLPIKPVLLVCCCCCFNLLLISTRLRLRLSKLRLISPSKLVFLLVCLILPVVLLPVLLFLARRRSRISLVSLKVF